MDDPSTSKSGLEVFEVLVVLLVVLLVVSVWCWRLLWLLRVVACSSASLVITASRWLRKSSCTLSSWVRRCSI